MKKAVIFDLDGTLTNTLKSLWKSTNMALATAGLPPHEIDSYKYFAGNGAKELIRKKDKKRKTYHNYYSEGKWGDSRN